MVLNIFNECQPWIPYLASSVLCCRCSQHWKIIYQHSFNRVKKNGKVMMYNDNMGRLCKFWFCYNGGSEKLCINCVNPVSKTRTSSTLSIFLLAGMPKVNSISCRAAELCSFVLFVFVCNILREQPIGKLIL